MLHLKTLSRGVLRASAAQSTAFRALPQRVNSSQFRFFSVEDVSDPPADGTGATVIPTVTMDSSVKTIESVDHSISGRKLKPREVVDQLNNYIVGQADAKRAVAVALRNRWRRQKLPEDLRQEVSPKNILMIGPTGCGKTEIARRLAKLSQAPFVKVEATKFTEVGFHGKDVDQILRDLIEVSIAMVKKARMEKVRQDVKEIVENRIVDSLAGKHAGETSRETFLKLLRSGDLDDRTIQVEVPVSSNGGMGATAVSFDQSGNMAAMNELLKIGKAFGGGKKTEKKTMTVAESRPVLEEMEMEAAIDMNDVTKDAITQAEENGIIFIDEIDKICSTGDYRGADASAEGVQRDLLPLIEGSAVSTKHGNIRTDHMLFIGSGAFHTCKPSDLMAELQGRLPIRVELSPLTENDLYRILTEPVSNLLAQQVALLKTEDVELVFKDDAIKEMARVAYEVNQTVENIGARRLHTIIEKVVEEISFEGAERTGETVEIDEAFVRDRVSSLVDKTDLSKFIL